MPIHTRSKQLDPDDHYFISEELGVLIPWAQLNVDEPFMFPNSKKNFSTVFIKIIWNFGHQNACFTYTPTLCKDYKIEHKDKDWVNQLSDDFLVRVLNDEEFDAWVKGASNF